MKSTRCQNNRIEDKKCEIGLIIKEFRELIDLYKSRFKKKSTKILKEALRKHEKTVNDENEDDIEYAKDSINELKSLKDVYF